MEKNCQQHWTKLNRNLLPVFCLFVASIAHAHPAWLHKVVDGELASGIILEVDYTTGILKIALTQISGQPKQEILRFTNETKFAVLVPANLDDILEFTFVKLKGKSADDRRAFLADTLTILPDWFPAEPGFRKVQNVLLALGKQDGLRVIDTAVCTNPV